MKQPKIVEIYCNAMVAEPANWWGGPQKKVACGKSSAMLIAGSYFCVCCKRQVKNVVWR